MKQLWIFQNLFCPTCSSALYNFLLWFYTAKQTSYLIIMSHHFSSSCHSHHHGWFCCKYVSKSKTMHWDWSCSNLWKTKVADIKFLYHNFVNCKNSSFYLSFDFVINFVLRYFSLEHLETAAGARSIFNFSVKSLTDKFLLCDICFIYLGIFSISQLNVNLACSGLWLKTPPSKLQIKGNCPAGVPLNDSW